MIIVIAGHYGVGKTNLALNMAFDYKQLGWDVTVADVDVVNPYFRSSDYRDELEHAGIRVIAPLFAGTSLDNPSLSAEIPSVIEWAGESDGGKNGDKRVLILDIGGDDVGATAIGRFSGILARYPYHFVYVVNKYRNLTQTPSDALEVLREVEFKSHLKATAIVNNSHLRDETSADTVSAAEAFGRACANEAGLPCVATTVPQALAARFVGDAAPCAVQAASRTTSDAVDVSDGAVPRSDFAAFVPFAATPELAGGEKRQNYYPVKKFVRTPWE